MDLGELRLSSGKRLRVFAVEAGQELAWVSSSTFTMQWPPRSGRIAEFPEIDGGAWFRAADAAVKLVPGQRPFLQRLADRVGWGPVR